MGSGEGGDRIQARSPELTIDALELCDDGPRLVAGRCAQCGEWTFPLRDRCPGCGGTLERALLPRRGTLWTWTTQGFEPKSPPYIVDGGEFEPFAVGYVELPGTLRVEGRLTEADGIRIGMEMEVVAIERGGRLTFAFAPVE